MSEDIEKMIVRALVPGFGSKRTMADYIVKQLGSHAQYCEPFCLSAAVLLAKEPSQKETVNDLHSDLINLARVLQNEESAIKLYDHCQRTLMGESLLLDAQRFLGDKEIGPLEDYAPADPERAYWYFLASWMGRNGAAGTERIDFQICVRWTNSGGSPTVRFRHAVDSMPAWHRRLKNVVILNRDAFRFLHKFEDSPKTAIYCDPPYASETRTSFRDDSGRSHYKHEFSDKNAKQSIRSPLVEEDGADQHDRLAKILRAYTKARIVVSYYDCERVRKLYEGWTFVECTRAKHMSATTKGGKLRSVAPELLIINGPSYGPPPFKNPLQEAEQEPETT